MATRRNALGLMGAGMGMAALAPRLARAAAAPRIPQRASVRVIADNDYAGDPDGLVALAHQLLTPKARTVLVTSSALDPTLPMPGGAARSAARGRDIAADLARRLGVAPPPVVAGGEVLGAIAPGEAAHAIVAEAMRDDPLPLVFTCGGPLTNLAAALALEPRIASRMSLIWIGGGSYPAGSWEYNLNADIPAARVVIEQSAIAIRQVPQTTYRQMQFSVAELYARLRPISPFARWLYERFTSPPDFVDVAGAWPLGDTPTVLLGSVTAESSTLETVAARRIRDDGTYGEEIAGRTIRVCTHIDARLAFEDFLALLSMNASHRS